MRTSKRFRSFLALLLLCGSAFASGRAVGTSLTTDPLECGFFITTHCGNWSGSTTKYTDEGGSAHWSPLVADATHIVVSAGTVVQTWEPTAISIGVNVITPNSMTNITTSLPLYVGEFTSAGTSFSSETVTPSAAPGPTFTATFTKVHSITSASGQTVTVDATAKTMVLSAGTWDAGLGFGENQSLKFTGFTNGANNAVYQIMRISGATAYFDDPGGTLVSETSGAAAVSAQTIIFITNSIASGSEYQFTTNVGTSRGFPWGSCNSGAKVDLNGFTLTGFQYCNSSLAAGYHIYGGTWNCAMPGNSALEACLNFNASSVTATGDLSVHHITGRNFANAYGGVGSPFFIYVSWGATTNNSGQAYLLRFYNNTGTVGSCTLGCSRSGWLNIGGVPIGPCWEFTRNDITINADADAAQGWQTAGGAECLTSHFNHMKTTTYTGTAQSARLMAPNANSIPSGLYDNASIEYNFFEPANSRAVRCRSRNCLVQHNIYSASALTYEASNAGTNHFADQVANFSEDYSKSWVHDNIFMDNSSGAPPTLVFMQAGKTLRVTDNHRWGAAVGLLAKVVANSNVNATVSTISCDSGTHLVTFTTSANHNMCSASCSASNTYGYTVTVAGTVGGFDFTSGVLDGVASTTTFTYQWPSACPSASGTGGTVTDSADTDMRLTNNDGMSATANYRACGKVGASSTGGCSAAGTNQAAGTIAACNSGVVDPLSNGDTSALSPCDP